MRPIPAGPPEEQLFLGQLAGHEHGKEGAVVADLRLLIDQHDPLLGISCPAGEGRVKARGASPYNHQIEFDLVHDVSLSR